MKKILIIAGTAGLSALFWYLPVMDELIPDSKTTLAALPILILLERVSRPLRFFHHLFFGAVFGTLAGWWGLARAIPTLARHGYDLSNIIGGFIYSVIVMYGGVLGFLGGTIFGLILYLARMNPEAVGGINQKTSAKS